jgi:hypothetical protein
MMELPLGEFLSLYDEFFVEEQRQRYKELFNFAYLSKNIAQMFGGNKVKIEDFLPELEPAHIYDVFKGEVKINDTMKAIMEQYDKEGVPYEIVNGKLEIKCGEG